MQAAFPGSRSWIQLTSELTSKLETRGNVSTLPSSLSGGGVHRDQGSKVKWKAQGLVSNVPGHEQCFSSYFVLGSLGNGFTILSTLVERRCLLVRGRRFYFIFILWGGSKSFLFLFFYKYTKESCNAASIGCSPVPRVCTFFCSWSCERRNLSSRLTVFYDSCIIFKIKKHTIFSPVGLPLSN